MIRQRLFVVKYYRPEMERITVTLLFFFKKCEDVKILSIFKYDKERRSGTYVLKLNYFEDEAGKKYLVCRNLQISL